MPTTEYRLADGTRVPGTTTIIGRFKPSGGLVHWAWDLGKRGIDYRDERDRAADAGTECHAMMDAWLKEEMIPTTGFTEARQGFESFKKWAKNQQLERIDTEMHLVSEKYRYGGTPDVLCRLFGEVCLLDYKTTKQSIYHEWLVQLAAYRQLIEENGLAKIERADLLRVQKASAAWTHHNWAMNQLDVAFKLFLLYRQAYDLDKQVKGLV